MCSELVSYFTLFLSYSVFESPCVYSHRTSQLQEPHCKYSSATWGSWLLNWTSEVSSVRLRVGRQPLRLLISPHTHLTLSGVESDYHLQAPPNSQHLTHPLPRFIFLCSAYNCCPRTLAPRRRGFWILITAGSPVPRKAPGVYLRLNKYLLNEQMSLWHRMIRLQQREHL